MSLWDSLFGSGTRQLNQSALVADQRLTAGRDAALEALNGGRSDINAGTDAALGQLNGAEPGLMQYLRDGYAGANDAIRTGYQSAEDAVTGAETRANAALQPYEEAGRGAQGLYSTALGVNGADKAGEFYQTYAANDPYREFRDEQAQKALERKYNAGGSFVGGGAAGGGSGRFATAVARDSLARGTEDLDKYLDRLDRASTRGQQVAGQMSSNTMQAGSQVGALRSGAADRTAANTSAEGSALAGLGAQFAGNRAQLEANRGTSLAGNRGEIANLQYGFGQQQAGNEINLGNALGEARTRPAQTLMGLGGLAVQAYTGFNPNGLRGPSGRPNGSAPASYFTPRD